MWRVERYVLTWEARLGVAERVAETRSTRLSTEFEENRRLWLQRATADYSSSRPCGSDVRSSGSRLCLELF